MQFFFFAVSCRPEPFFGRRHPVSSELESYFLLHLEILSDIQADVVVLCRNCMLFERGVVPSQTFADVISAVANLIGIKRNDVCLFWAESSSVAEGIYSYSLKFGLCKVYRVRNSGGASVDVRIRI